MSVKLRYNIGRLLLRTAFRNTIHEVEMEKCTNPLAFSFGENGWHFIVEYLRELNENPRLPLRDSILYRYHKTYTPASFDELVVSSESNIAFRPGFFRFPWGDFMKDFDHRSPEKNRYTTRFCGPSDDKLIEADAKNIVELRASITCSGYNPWKYPHDFISGVFLCKDNGDYRFVVLQGNHRVGVMSFLGIKKFQVRCMKNRLSFLCERDVDDWYYVKRRLCSKEDAIKFFNVFFILNGMERAEEFNYLTKKSTYSTS